MDRTGPVFVAMMKKLQKFEAEVTLHLSGGGTVRVKGKELRWEPHEDLIQINDYTYVDVASITEITLQRPL